MANNAARNLNRPVLLLTRPQAASEAFWQALDPMVRTGVDCIISPVLKIVPTGHIPDMSATCGAVFSSAHAPTLAGDGQGACAYCVGAKTAAAAKACGWDVRNVAQTADELVAAMEDTPGPLVHIAGRHRRGNIATRLTAKGIKTTVAEVYDQQRVDLSKEAHTAIISGALVITPIFSPRSAEQLRATVVTPAALDVIAISDAVAGALIGWDVSKLTVAQAPTHEEMRRCVEIRLQNATLP